MARSRLSAKRALPWVLVALAGFVAVVSWKTIQSAEVPAVGESIVSAPPARTSETELSAPAQPVPGSSADRESVEPESVSEIASEVREPREVLRGVVLGVDRRPLEGARVHFQKTTPVYVQKTPGSWIVSHEQAEVLVAVSNEHGEFVADPYDLEYGLPCTAELDGYKFLDAYATSPGSDALSAIEVVMTSTGTVSLTVVDASGRPVPRLDLSVGPTESEVVRGGGGEAPRQHGRTDEEGHVELRASSGVKVSIELHDEDWRATAEHVVGDELSFERSGNPLVLRDGEVRSLTARLGHTMLLRGKVVYPDSRPVAHAHLRLFDRDPSTYGWGESRTDSRADDEGRFAFRLHDLAADAEVTLLAADGRFFTYRDQGLRHAAVRRFRPRDAVDSKLEIELVVEELLALSGRVVDAQEETFNGTMWAIPAGADYLLEKTALGLLPITGLEPETGTFRIGALLPGMYDIVVKRGAPRTYFRFPGFSAGTENIELRIEDDRGVDIRISVAGVSEPTSLRPLLLTHHLREPKRASAPSGPVDVRTWDPELWLDPEYDDWSEEHEKGRTIYLFDGTHPALEHRFPLQQPGWYSVGGYLLDANGRRSTRLLSEPVYLDEGTFTFILHPRWTTRVVGRVPVSPGTAVFVEVLDGAGHRVPRPDGEPFTPTDSRGQFVVEDVPVGPIRIRTGTREILSSGGFSFELAADAKAGEDVRAEFL